MHTTTNINILVIDNFVDNIEDNIEDVSMLIIVNRDYVGLGFAKKQIETILIIFFA
jgi:hypothetical protein